MPSTEGDDSGDSDHDRDNTVTAPDAEVDAADDDGSSPSSSLRGDQTDGEVRDATYTVLDCSTCG